jgi:hypothetical protein
MGAGMQVALYTTLSGISASLLLSVYCKILDRYADSLVAEIIAHVAWGQAAGEGPPRQRATPTGNEPDHEQFVPGRQ